ncbi:MAG: histone H1 [Candidatus Amoebophilus sp.]
MKEFENLLKHVKDLEEDFTKFYDKDNKAAGIRIRKGMLELKQISQRIRLEVQNKKNESTSA